MKPAELIKYAPGAIGRIVELHGAYYASHWDLGLYFEAKVASELAAFFQHFEPDRDGAWFARLDGQVVGSIFIDGSDWVGKGARLRWFILAPEHQGRGIGNQLMQAAMDFCANKGFQRVYLTTFAGLDAARHLYERYGFRLEREEDGSQLTGNAALMEQIFVYTPAPQ